MLGHSDDFFDIWPMSGLQRFADWNGTRGQQGNPMLGRNITTKELGVKYVSGLRHVEAVLSKLGTERVSPAAKPYEKQAYEDQTADSCELLEEDLDNYKSLSARLNYLAMDRPDIQFVVKELMRKMSSPKKSDAEAF